MTTKKQAATKRAARRAPRPRPAEKDPKPEPKVEEVRGVTVDFEEGVFVVKCTECGPQGGMLHAGDSAAAAMNHYQSHVTLDGWDPSAAQRPRSGTPGEPAPRPR